MPVYTVQQLTQAVLQNLPGQAELPVPETLWELLCLSNSRFLPRGPDAKRRMNGGPGHAHGHAHGHIPVSFRRSRKFGQGESCIIIIREPVDLILPRQNSSTSVGPASHLTRLWSTGMLKEMRCDKADLPAGNSEL